MIELNDKGTRIVEMMETGIGVSNVNVSDILREYEARKGQMDVLRGGLVERMMVIKKSFPSFTSVNVGEEPVATLAFLDGAIRSKTNNINIRLLHVFALTRSVSEGIVFQLPSNAEPIMIKGQVVGPDDRVYAWGVTTATDDYVAYSEVTEIVVVKKGSVLDLLLLERILTADS